MACIGTRERERGGRGIDCKGRGRDENARCDTRSSMKWASCMDRVPYRRLAGFDDNPMKLFLFSPSSKLSSFLRGRVMIVVSILELIFGERRKGKVGSNLEKVTFQSYFFEKLRYSEEE